MLFSATSRPGPSRARAFAISLLIHCIALSLIGTASRQGWLDGPRRSSLPQRVTSLSQSRKIIWYTRGVELPPVTPKPAAGDQTNQRGRLYAPQRIQASAAKPESRRQMVLQESPPEIRLRADLQVPNVLAWNPPAPSPPQPKRRFTITAPPPRPATAMPLPQVAAPQVPMAAVAKNILPVRAEPARLPAPKRFQAPAVAPREPRQPRALIPAEAPKVAAGPAVDPEIVGLGPAPKVSLPEFAVPQPAQRPAPVRRAIADAPPSTLVPDPSVPATMIVGLDPAQGVKLPPPPGNRSAEFSAGPEVNEKKGDAPVQLAKAAIRAPNLGIAPTVTRPPLPGMDRATFRRQILAGASRAGALRNGNGSGEAAPADPVGHGVLQGSTVYTLALDMPNISSYEGSWILRFTERGGSSPEDLLTPPVALRKVDPKYIASAAAEGIEGKVLLYAVIRRDGRVDEVRLVQGIDERLDASAVAAFSKWEFEPATRNGAPVDLEAVVQIPFRLKRSVGP